MTVSMTASMTASLPAYSPSAPAPSYSHDPLPHEHTLSLSPAAHFAHRRPTGKFTKHAKGIRLVLYDQHDDAPRPEYGRHGTLRGYVSFDPGFAIRRVCVKVGGRLVLTLAEGGTTTTPTLQLSRDLWLPSPNQTSCPARVPFSFDLPATYERSDRTLPLLPSYSIAFPGVPGLFAESSYDLTLVVEHSRNHFWKKRSTRYARANPHPHRILTLSCITKPDNSDAILPANEAAPSPPGPAPRLPLPLHHQVFPRRMAPGHLHHAHPLKAPLTRRHQAYQLSRKPPLISCNTTKQRFFNLAFIRSSSSRASRSTP